MKEAMLQLCLGGRQKLSSSSLTFAGSLSRFAVLEPFLSLCCIFVAAAEALLSPLRF